jgi:hypothetical protein
MVPMKPTALFAALVIAAVPACSSDSSAPWSPGGGDGDASASGGTAGSPGQGGASGKGGSPGTGGSAGANAGGSAGSGDPNETYRQACIDRINELRATKGLAPYTRWTSAESCVDQQATYDETNNSPHGAWIAKAIACDGYGSGQNECLGSGAAGIVGCLNSMWAEKDQAGCSGCDACTGPGADCPGCDFYGKTTGDVCGHYVNMSAKWFTQAACGFSSKGSWAAINFQ